MDMVKDFRHIINSIQHGIRTRPSALTEEQKLRGLKQYALNRAKAMMGYHQGAEVSAIRGDWPSLITSATAITRSDFMKLCARSEMAYRTDTWMKRAVQVLSTFVVGQGLRPYPAIRDQNTGEINEEISRKLAMDFERFNDQGIRNGTQPITYFESQGLSFRTMAVYGNCITNIVKSRPGSWLPFAFQFIKPTRLDFSKDTFFDTTAYFPQNKPIIVHGMEINEFGEPQKFYIANVKEPFDASRMFISFYPSETEAYMGLPWSTHALGNVWDNQQLFEDKLKQSRVASRLGLKIMPKDKDAFSMAMNNASTETGEEYIDLDFQGLVAADKESLQAIKMDDTLKDSFLPLVRQNLMAFAAGMGFSYQNMSSDLEGMNFAASRANIINDNRFFRGLFKFITKTVEQRKWERFVEWEILSGKLAGLVSYPDYLRDPWPYNQAYWLPMDGEEWVDPLKDAEAIKLLYNIGQITYQELCAMAGKDYRAVLQQKAKEKKMFVEMDLRELIPSPVEKSAGVQAYTNPE
jgi:lambda family phage portal protein